MEQYRCKPEELPSRLFRVQYPESQTTRSANGLVAADTSTLYDNDNDRERYCFKQAVENHFTWSYRGCSMFISLFSDRRHAENWGCKQPWRMSNTHDGQWTLLAIDTSSLQEVYVFKVRRLIDALGVKLPEKAEQHQEGAYICLHKIPSRAIVEEEEGSDVKSSHDFVEYYDPYLGYSSDDSGVINNINDDLMKIYEGDW